VWLTIRQTCRCLRRRSSPRQQQVCFRLAGAGCIGYATAGIASLMAPGYRLMRIENLAAISFNLLGAISAWIAVASGDGGLLAPVVAVAASFFTVALSWMDRQLAS
jgi:hypothetical protein